jgi:LPLT family lysophospholipid transporter-like MFS transporter
MLQGVVAAGIAVGAVIAAKYVSLRGAVRVLPIGVTMGVIVISMIFVTQTPVAMVLMIAIGASAGFFVVPMNALLQHRGHVLMGAGHSIAVQNFNENIGILAMVGIYSLMLSAGLDIKTAIVLFGLFVSGTMVLVMWRHRRNQALGDLLHLIGVDSHGAAHPGKASRKH